MLPHVPRIVVHQERVSVRNQKPLMISGSMPDDGIPVAASVFLLLPLKDP
jgi:hypothetical protein